MTRRRSLSLHWHLHRNRGSVSEPPSTPGSPVSRYAPPDSPASQAMDSASSCEPSPGLTKAQMRESAIAAWSEALKLVRNDWEWPCSTPTDAAPSRIDTKSPYQERETYLTPAASPLAMCSSFPNPPNSAESVPPSANQDSNVTSDQAMLRSADAKRRIRRHMLDEMQWNENLRYYHERRNAWTGTVEVIMPMRMERTHSNVTDVIRSQKFTSQTISRRHSESHRTSSGKGSSEAKRSQISGTEDELVSPFGGKTSTRRHSTAPLVNHQEGYRTIVSQDSPSSLHSIRRFRSTSRDSLRQSGRLANSLDESHRTTHEQSHDADGSRRHPRSSIDFNHTSSAAPPKSNDGSPLMPQLRDLQPESTRHHTRTASTSSLVLELIPRYEPVLSPDNPMRRESDDPNTELTIYREMIEHGRTPVVPINLSTVVRAAVAGWKDSYAWLLV